MWLLLTACSGAPDSGPADLPTSDSTPTDPCPEGQLWDGAACVPEACGLGPFAVDDADVYVLPGGTGDGGRDAPVGTLAEALDRAPGGRIALGAGTWREALTLKHAHAGLALLGRCPELTVLDGADAPDTATVWLDAREGDRVDLTGMTVTGGHLYGVVVLAGALHAERVQVRANEWGGLHAETPAAALHLVDVEVRENLPPRRGDGGSGVEALDGAVLTAERLSVTDNTTWGVLVVGAKAELVDLQVTDTAASGTGLGLGLEVTEGGQVHLDGATITGSAAVGVRVDGSTLDARGLVIGDTHPLDDGDYGYALWAWPGASVTCVDCAATASHDAGLYVDGAALTWSGRVDGVTAGASLGGLGVWAQYGATLDLSGTTVSGWDLAGVLVADAGSHLAADGLVITGGRTAAEVDGTALAVEGGATAELVDLQAEGARGYTVWARHTGTVLRLETPSLGPPVPTQGTRFGNVLLARDGAAVEVVGGELDVTGSVGLEAIGAGASLVADGVTLHTTAEGPAVAAFAALGGVATVRDSVATDLGELGAYVADPGSVLTLDGVALDGVRATVDQPTAAGLLALGGGVASLRDTWIRDVHGAGVVTAEPDTTLDWEGGGVDGVGRATSMESAVGVSAETLSTVSLRSWEARAVEGPGLLASGGAVLSLTDGALTDDAGAQAIARNGTLRLERVAVGAAPLDASWGGGVGVFATDVLGPYTVELVDVEVAEQSLAAVWAQGEGSVRLVGGDLAGGQGREVGAGRVHGNAILARDGAWVEADGTTLRDARVAVLLDAAGGVFEATWLDNALDLQAQGCAEGGPEFDADTDDVVLCPEHDALLLPLEFQLTLPALAPAG